MGLYENSYVDAAAVAGYRTLADTLERAGLSMQAFGDALAALGGHLPTNSAPAAPQPQRTGRRGIDLSGAVIRNND